MTPTATLLSQIDTTGFDPDNAVALKIVLVVVAAFALGAVVLHALWQRWTNRL